nr:leucine-rich repeat and guanylate kinase domain-containing protein isoform X3 [Nothobranchius furzeri]
MKRSLERSLTFPLLSDSNPASATETPSGELQGQFKMEADVLTDEMVSRGLSRSGSSRFFKISFPNLNLKDISVLHKYVYLQKLELPNNRIKDLSCLSHTPYLVILDLSGNEIYNFFEFQPLQYLREVNLSHNRMTNMKDLSGFVSLCKLNLDHNGFCEISGLEQCCRLTHLSLAHNKVTKMSGLDGLPLTHLCLKGNQIKRVAGLENTKHLHVLDLSVNHITRLSGLKNLHLLGSLNLEKNQIREIQELEHNKLPLLRDLNLQGNPVQGMTDYRMAVIFLFQHLTILDQVKISTEEKVASVNKFHPSMDVLAFRDHMTNLVYQLTQPQVLYDSTQPLYPVLVLTGPDDCGQRQLLHRLCQEFSEYFGFGICHTTRKPYFGEKNGFDYHFVSEEDFQNMIHMGKFVHTMKYGDHQFGLSRDAIEYVAREGLACCVSLELEMETYRNTLSSRERYTPEQIEAAVSRLELYANIHTQRPGFFDCVIPCDDWEQAYQTLEQVVKDLFSLEEEREEEKSSSKTSPNSSLTGHSPAERATSALSESGFGLPSSLSASASDPSGFTCRSFKIQTELNPERTLAELASIRRREQPVREAFVGKRPGVLSQLFKRKPSSQYHQDPGAHFVQKDNSSSDESCASSSLTVPSSASVLGKPLDESVLIHSLDSFKEYVISGQTSDRPQPGIDACTAVGSPANSRPGSRDYYEQPPTVIGANISAVSRPNPSPTPSLDLGLKVKGNENMEE